MSFLGEVKGAVFAGKVGDGKLRGEFWKNDQSVASGNLRFKVLEWIVDCIVLPAALGEVSEILLVCTSISFHPL